MFKDLATTPQRSVSHQSSDTTPMEQRPYLHLLGAMIYLLKSRPDVATAISFGSTHASKPTVGAFMELLHCLSYLENTQDMGLILRTRDEGTDFPLQLRCYVDASYLTHSDSRSHSGFCMSLGNIGTFYSKSQKQTTVATSSTHAETRALYSLVVEIIYVVFLTEELGIDLQLPVVVFEDNSAVIDITADISARTKRCRHFLMLINYIRESVDKGLIEIRKVDTNDNLADILTKIVTGTSFRDKANALLGAEPINLTMI
jgi:hypothetical protein